MVQTRWGVQAVKGFDYLCVLLVAMLACQPSMDKRVPVPECAERQLAELSCWTDSFSGTVGVVPWLSNTGFILWQFCRDCGCGALAFKHRLYFMTPSGICTWRGMLKIIINIEVTFSMHGFVRPLSCWKVTISVFWMDLGRVKKVRSSYNINTTKVGICTTSDNFVQWSSLAFMCLYFTLCFQSGHLNTVRNLCSCWHLCCHTV